MGAKFVSASSQYLENTSPPITAMPFTVGMWLFPTQTAAAQTAFSICAGGGTTDYYEILQTAAGSWRALKHAGAASAPASTGVTVVANTWYFILARFISATNIRCDAFSATGLIGNGNDTTSTTPASMTREAFGCRDVSTRTQFFDGIIAEYWTTNTDIQLDGLNTQDATVRQLAYGGPFSIPSVKKDIVEYHSFRHDLSSDSFESESDLLPILGETLTNVGTVTLGIHPPLPYWYVNPQDHSIPFIV